MYPAFVNCTTIDWFSEWPQDALLEVAEKYLETMDLSDEEVRNNAPYLTTTLLKQHLISNPDWHLYNKVHLSICHSNIHSTLLDFKCQTLVFNILQTKGNVANIFVTVHKSVVDTSKRMLLEVKRHNYVTPTNYLELVSGYKT